MTAVGAVVAPAPFPSVPKAFKKPVQSMSSIEHSLSCTAHETKPTYIPMAMQLLPDTAAVQHNDAKTASQTPSPATPKHRACSASLSIPTVTHSRQSSSFMQAKHTSSVGTSLPAVVAAPSAVGDGVSPTSRALLVVAVGPGETTWVIGADDVVIAAAGAPVRGLTTVATGAGDDANAEEAGVGGAVAGGLAATGGLVTMAAGADEVGGGAGVTGADDVNAEGAGVERATVGAPATLDTWKSTCREGERVCRGTIGRRVFLGRALFYTW